MSLSLAADIDFNLASHTTLWLVLDWIFLTALIVVYLGIFIKLYKGRRLVNARTSTNHSEGRRQNMKFIKMSSCIIFSYFFFSVLPNFLYIYETKSIRATADVLYPAISISTPLIYIFSRREAKWRLCCSLKKERSETNGEPAFVIRKSRRRQQETNL